MNLLLFFSALLAGLTGAITGGQRIHAPSVEHSVTQALEVAVKKAPGLFAPSRFRVDTIHTPLVSELLFRPHNANVSVMRTVDMFTIFAKRLI
ncbi:hypothetical protein [Aquisediminimonas profunda]|uniref:hypothetical protein n=1 Tax=Aquisediminimonas profunda TaxID=1550733 RepID=UPI001C62AA1B|nr:hypothetical protein [Aquisediminimonas profunda]